jgi:hypothetical protein
LILKIYNGKEDNLCAKEKKLSLSSFSAESKMLTIKTATNPAEQSSKKILVLFFIKV